MRVRLVLVRHGEVDANRSYHYLGRRDDELNATGLRQADALATALAGLDLDLVVSSPLRRALETARRVAAANHLQVDTDDRLVELDFGAWEGRSRREVVEQGEEIRTMVERWEADPSLAVPGGESMLELRDRVVELADDLAAGRPGSTVVVVSHMGPIKALLCAALDLPLDRARRIFLDPATVSVVDWGGKKVVRLVNGHTHLGFADARWAQSG